MKPKYLLPITLEKNPFLVRTAQTDFEKLSLIVGSVFFAIGAGLFLFSDKIIGLVFIGIAFAGFAYSLVGFLSYLNAVKKNKEILFDPVKNLVSEKAGLKISNRHIAYMWMEGSTKTAGHRFSAQARKGKEFNVAIY